eukprot:6293460-Alexandrium_andersonii.AAC.1
MPNAPTKHAGGRAGGASSGESGGAEPPGRFVIPIVINMYMYIRSYAYSQSRRWQTCCCVAIVVFVNFAAFEHK